MADVFFLLFYNLSVTEQKENENEWTNEWFLRSGCRLRTMLPHSNVTLKPNVTVSTVPHF